MSDFSTILEAVRSRRSALRKSERKVADAVLAEPRAFLSATLAQAAAAAAVSEPTVIRFATAVGCGGFQDFKLRLAQALALGTPATHSVIHESDRVGTIAAKIFDYTITSLDWARGRVAEERLEAAVALLAGARSIAFFGIGNSGIVARDAEHKAALFGAPCSAPQDPHQQIMAAGTLRAGDVAVVISNTGKTRETMEVARLARTAGATVIGIIGVPSPLAALCDVPIIVETLDNTDVYTPTISRIAALVVVDVLATAVALRRDPDQRERVAGMLRFMAERRER